MEDGVDKYKKKDGSNKSKVTHNVSTFLAVNIVLMGYYSKFNNNPGDAHMQRHKAQQVKKLLC